MDRNEKLLKTDKVITWVGLCIAVLCTVLAIFFAMRNGKVKELAAVRSNGLFDATYWILVCLVVASVAAMLIFLLVRIANSFKEDKEVRRLNQQNGTRNGMSYAAKFFLLIGIVVVVCLVSYMLSKGNDVTPALMEKNNISESTSKLIGAACWMVYILVIGAAVAIVYTEIAKMTKK
ncbi:MAG: hypothetical protein IJ760_02435 [Bacteroidales bacterium]|nr:hypothetical protein [Bacteroidales bacterium]